MKKLTIVAVVIGLAVAISTGVGVKLVKRIDERLGLRTLEARINDNLRELKHNRGTVYEQMHRLRSKAGAERAATQRAEEERAKLDAACQRLADRIKDSGDEIQWGPHTLSRTQAIALLTDWGKSVDQFTNQVQVAQSKSASYEAATHRLEQDSARFANAISKLEVKLDELLNAKEVLHVQRQVSEILAAAAGRDVPGETAELLAELQSENDRLRGEIGAYGFAATTDALVGPEDDLDDVPVASILQRYGITPDPSRTAQVLPAPETEL